MSESRLSRTLRVTQEGMTLIELVVTIVILGITVVAVTVGMGMTASGTDIHRQEADVSLALSNAAEAVLSAPYVTCAQTSSYSSAATGAGVPPDWAASNTVSVFSVKDTAGNTFSAGCTDPGLQVVELRVTSPNSRAKGSLSVVKRSP